jgi:hypothetical protein
MRAFSVRPCLSLRRPPFPGALSVSFGVALTLALGCSDPGAGSLTGADDGTGGASTSGGAKDGATASGSGGDAGTPIAPGAEGDAATDPAAPPAPASDAGTGTGTPGGSCAGLPLCDDFESAAVGGPPSAATWSVATPSCSGTGALAVDGTVAHSGTRSIKISGGGGYCNHVFLATSKALATVGTHVFGRFFVRLGDALGDGHVTFAAMRDESEKKDLRMGGQNKVLMWNRESDDATLPSMSPVGTSKSIVPATARWLCVEIEVNGSTGTLHTWVDGAAVEGLVEDGTPTPDVDAPWLSKSGWRPAISDFRLGWESYGGQASTLWFDDVALGAQRIGCGT